MAAKDLLEFLDPEDPAYNDLDLALRAHNLREEHGGHWEEHPEYPFDDWASAAYDNDTRLGYWEWVANSITNDDEEDEDAAPTITLPTIGERSFCYRCEQDLEWNGTAWHDRGGNTTCGTYRDRDGELVEGNHTNPHIPYSIK